MLNERISRTIAKIATYRLLLTIMQAIMITYIMAEVEESIAIAIGGFIVNTVVYFGYERAWNYSKFGQTLNTATVFADSWVITIYKTIIWRLCVLANSFIVPWIVTESVDDALMYASLTFLIHTTIYIIHERIWNRVRWGRNIIVDKSIS